MPRSGGSGRPRNILLAIEVVFALQCSFVAMRKKRIKWVSCPLFIFGPMKMDTCSIDDRIRDIAIRVSEKNGLEFVHAEIAGAKKSLTVRIYIDKPGGVNLEDCSLVSREMETVLDEDDFIPDPYLLEVSSPGLERQLYSLDDFQKFVGRKAKVKTASAINSQSNFTGRITAIEGDEIVFDDKTAGSVRIPFGRVAKANLRVDLAEEFKKR
jgi:ribosome maturation factor RimP